MTSYFDNIFDEVYGRKNRFESPFIKKYIKIVPEEKVKPLQPITLQNIGLSVEILDQVQNIFLLKL